MITSDLGEATVEFAANYYKEEGIAPSIRKMCDGVPGLSNRSFYGLFEGGIIEVCKLANIPEPNDRIKATSKAREEKQRPRKSKAGDLDAVDEAIMQRLDRLVMTLGVTGRIKALDAAIEFATEILPRVDKLTRLSGVKERDEALDKQIDLVSKFNVYTFNFDVETPADMIDKMQRSLEDYQLGEAILKRLVDEIPSLRKKVEEYKNIDDYELAKMLGIDESTIQAHCYENTKQRCDDSLGTFINAMVRAIYYE